MKDIDSNMGKLEFNNGSSGGILVGDLLFLDVFHIRGQVLVLL